MRPSLCNPYFFDRMAAVWTRLSGLSVDGKGDLEFTCLTQRVFVGPDSRPSGFHRSADHIDDGFLQSFGCSRPDCVGCLKGMDSGLEKRLIRIDISDAGNNVLVKDDRFDRPMRLGKIFLELAQFEEIRGRFRPHLLERFIIIPLFDRQQREFAELAHVKVTQSAR